jgi:hypothetical protein
LFDDDFIGLVVAFQVGVEQRVWNLWKKREMVL